jgi:hypothetical protein
MSSRQYNPLSQCVGKRPYSNKRDAKRAARTMEQHIGRMHPYRCPTCGQFHLGHKPPPYDWSADDD